MILVEEKGSVKFFKDENGKQFQQIGDRKVEAVVDGPMRFKHIKKVGEFSVQYNLNGVHGFSIWSKDNRNLEDNIWDLDEAVEIANSMQ